MESYICSVCSYEYDPSKGDPEHGIAPGTKFEDLPEDWTCPVCGIDISFDEETLEEGSIVCPQCGELLEFDLEAEDEEEEKEDD